MDTKAVDSLFAEGAVSRRQTANGHFVPGTSPALRALERVLDDISPTEIPVLLIGESGTGKEVVAMEIHRRSLRSDQPFIKVSCAALTPASLAERLPVLANGNGDGGLRGTLFLDEIADLHPECQPKLVHLLSAEDGTDGARRPRVICVSSRSLEDLVRAGRFREELYYRINGVCLRLPPLRQCRQDVPALLNYFLAKYADLFGRPQTVLSAQAQSILAEYSWPGNIRELENVAKKIVAMGDERAALRDLETAQRVPSDGNGGARVSLKETARAASRRAERELILKVLERTRWNRKRAAQELQISYKALLYKLKQIGLDDSTAT